MRMTLITICHNSRLKITDYVDSFLLHHNSEDDRLKFQFVFVENSSDPTFQEVVRPLKESGFEVIVLNSENEGFGRGCNTGALHALGDILLFANPDIRFLSNLGCLIESTPPITWGTVKQVTSSSSVYSIDLLPEYKGFLFELFQFHRLVNLFPKWFLRKSYVVGSFMLVSKKLFVASEGFHPAFFLYYEEAELSRRLQSMSGPPVLCPSISVFHEGFGSQNSSEDIFKHEAKGFLTYCYITKQPELINKRLKILGVMSLLSKASRKRYKILQEIAFLQDC